mmetsp:Transcript_5989/g.11683  ORF Transcript_5989/g.11683 Transcript_5989/m.11683 type:complete len:216 (-) Transcript_5989:665-1312(-)
MSQALTEACTQGQALLDDLLGTVSEESSRFEAKTISPAFLASAKCLVFLNSWRAGVFAGGAYGTGFAIAKSSSGSWTAPCFVTLKKLELGAFFGYEKSRTLMSALTKSSIQKLIDNEYTEFGSDVTVQLWPLADHGPNDQISVSPSDWVTASCSTGIIFDFSLSGGGMRIDDEKNHAVYGEGVSAADLLGGSVDKPKEMIPLYQKITAISKMALQ